MEEEVQDEVINDIPVIDPVTEPTPDPMAQFWADAHAKAKELSLKYNNRVIVPFYLAGDSDTDFVRGFLFEPDGLTDAKIMAAKVAGVEISIPKAIQALESLILFAESDPRMKQKKYMNGAAFILLKMVDYATPIYEKKIA